MSRDGAGGGRHALLHPFLPSLHDDTRPTTAPTDTAANGSARRRTNNARAQTRISRSAREAQSRATTHTSCTKTTEQANARTTAPNTNNKFGRLHRPPRSTTIMQHCQLPALPPSMRLLKLAEPAISDPAYAPDEPRRDRSVFDAPVQRAEDRSAPHQQSDRQVCRLRFRQ